MVDRTICKALIQRRRGSSGTPGSRAQLLSVAQTQCTEVEQPPAPQHGQSGGGGETPPPTNTRDTSPNSSPSYHSHQGPRDSTPLSLQTGDVLGVPEVSPKPRSVSCVWAQPPALHLPSAQEAAKPQLQPMAGWRRSTASFAHPREGVLGNSSHEGTCRGRICKTRQLLQLQSQGKIGYSATLKCQSASGMWSKAALAAISSSQEGVDASSSVSCPKPFHPVQEILAPPA